MNWFTTIITMIIALMLIGLSNMALAAPKRNVTSVRKITCSYGGQYKHTSTNAHSARKATSNACFEAQMDLFQSQRGALPDDDQADYIIESCVNQTRCS